MSLAGQNSRTPTVMLHGWGSHAGIWQPVLPAISGELDVTCADLPGHGSFRDFSSPWTLQNVATELLKRLPSTPAWWVGWSLGGQIALSIARHAPARVKGLVLVSVSPRFVSGGDWPHGMAPETLQAFHDDLSREPLGTLERFASLQLGSQVERERLRTIRDLLLFRQLPPDPDSLAGGLNVLRDTDWRPVLSEIAQPTLVIYGDRDRLVPAAAGEALAAALPRARTRCIEGAAHMPFLTHEKQWAQALLEFIGESES